MNLLLAVLLAFPLFHSSHAPAVFRIRIDISVLPGDTSRTLDLSSTANCESTMRNIEVLGWESEISGPRHLNCGKRIRRLSGGAPFLVESANSFAVSGNASLEHPPFKNGLRDSKTTESRSRDHQLS
jgi:hypothetical protein